MIRIWLNHWFSTAYSIIELIKENEQELYIIGSNTNEDSVIKLVCDEWYLEPYISGDEYVDFCLDFCKNHNIQLFLPRREMLEISRRKAEFSEIGVKVMVEDYNMMNIFNQKSKAYHFFTENEIGIVPEYYIVTTLQEFIEAYRNLKEKYKRVCFKFEQDTGGKSYRLIDNSRKGYSALMKKQNTRMTLESVLDALDEKEVFDPIMVMPQLSGEEYSVDCLETKNGLIMLPRIKDNSKIERLCYDEKILEMCSSFQKKACLQHPYNIQFKCLNGIPYFLEVNTRMSGGVQIACLASEVNIPNIAVNKLLGRTVHWKIVKEEKKIGQILLPVVLE